MSNFHIFKNGLKLYFKLFHRLKVKEFDLDSDNKPNIYLSRANSFWDIIIYLVVIPGPVVFVICQSQRARLGAIFLSFFVKFIVIRETIENAIEEVSVSLKAGANVVCFGYGYLGNYETEALSFDIPGRIARCVDGRWAGLHVHGIHRRYVNDWGMTTGCLIPFRDKVNVVLGPQVDLGLQHNIDPAKLRHSDISKLSQALSQACFQSFPIPDSLYQMVLDAAKQTGYLKVSLEDETSGSLSYFSLLVRVRLFASFLVSKTEKGETVGFMLPNSVGGAIVFFGISSAGRVPVMINFSAGRSSILLAIEASKIRILLTSRVFVSIAKFEELMEYLREFVEIIYVEDIRKQITLLDKISGLINFRKPLVKQCNIDTSLIIFTAGSSGKPKGVVFSHKTLIVNVNQLKSRAIFLHKEKCFSCLPLFHSFGLYASLLVPLSYGIITYLYPTPLHFRSIPKKIYESKSTIFFSTNTLINSYLEALDERKYFRNLRYVVLGGEKVKQETKDRVRKIIGHELLEGYGMTETSPLVSVNMPYACKEGSVGMVLPGIKTKLTPFEGITKGGVLNLKGGNVMNGYLSDVSKDWIISCNPLKENWHNSGDVVEIDENDYITIQGRSSRFAKIGGEMVSLGAVEELAMHIWPGFQNAVVVLSSDKKGEKIVVVTTFLEAKISDFLEKLKEGGHSRLMAPSKLLIFDDLPALPSGKRNYNMLTQLVKERLDPELVV